MAMLEKSLSYGCIDTVVLFANSPHYSMTKNGETFGTTENETNLAEENYRAFVDYFLTITEHFLEKGIPVKFISPFNEPQWAWGGSYAKQEGCHYEPEQIEKLSSLFAEGIRERGLKVKLMVPENGMIGDGQNPYYDAVSKDRSTSSEIGSYAYHSYWFDNNFNEKMKFGLWHTKNYPCASFDMTEWCELPCTHDVGDVEAAVLMARVIASDFSLERCNSWSNWVALNQIDNRVDGKIISDGLFYADGSFNNVKKTARYAAFAHFSKFIPAGSVMLEATTNKRNRTDDGNSWRYLTNFAAFRTPEGKKILVIVNEDEAQKINLSAGIVTKMKVYTTDADHTLEKTFDGRFRRTIEVGKNSITTVVFG